MELFLALGLIFSSPTASARSNATLSLPPDISRHINSAIRLGKQLHRALVAHDDETVELTLEELEAEMLLSEKTLEQGRRPAQIMHQSRIFHRLRSEVIRARQAPLHERREAIAEVFRDLVTLRQIFAAKEHAKVFYCDKDRTIWIQESTRGNHPFGGEFKKCSVPIL